jgi:hypothetical protein
MTVQPQTQPAHVAILQIMNGGHVAGAVACLAQLGIPDLVDGAPKSAEELASQIGADPQALYRLMRATASVGVLAERGPTSFRKRRCRQPCAATLLPAYGPLRSWAAESGTGADGLTWKIRQRLIGLSIRN